MDAAELKRSVREYKRLWEESGLETSPYWKIAAGKVAAGEAPVQTLSAWLAEIGACPACRFCSPGTPSFTVSGNGEGQIYFLAPTLSGPEAELLGKIVEAMGQNPRTSLTATLAPSGRCFGSLREQIQFVRPKVVVAFGSETAALLGAGGSRGQFASFAAGVSVLSTLAPKDLLANPAGKKTVWEDMKLVLRHLEGK